MSTCLAPARAAASRRNGARSRGPATPEGKARSSQNALRHGLCAQKFVVVGGERAAEFAALEAALIDELAPDSTLQSLLAGRIARAVWRLERAERIEAELFARMMEGGNMGLALIRDGNNAGAFGTLLRYRGTATAELWRALRLLKALQAEAADAARSAPAEAPIEPESRAIPHRTDAEPPAAHPGSHPVERDEATARTPHAPPTRPVPPEDPRAAPPNEPEDRSNPEESPPTSPGGSPAPPDDGLRPTNECPVGRSASTGPQAGRDEPAAMPPGRHAPTEPCPPGRHAAAA